MSLNDIFNLHINQFIIIKKQLINFQNMCKHIKIKSQPYKMNKIETKDSKLSTFSRLL